MIGLRLNGVLNYTNLHFHLHAIALPVIVSRFFFIYKQEIKLRNFIKKNKKAFLSFFPCRFFFLLFSLLSLLLLFSFIFSLFLTYFI